MFEKIRKFYEMGLYAKPQLIQFVLKGKLTPAEYEEITGEQYKTAKEGA